MPNRGTVHVGAGADGVVRADLAGEFDSTNAGRLRDALLRAVEQAGEPGVEIDLSAVRFMDSMGLAALVAAFHLAHPRAVPFRVGRSSVNATRLLEMTGLARLWGLSGNGQNHRICA
jgi:anti-anti-sigma factor